MKTFRIFKDVKAINEFGAIEKLDNEINKLFFQGILLVSDLSDLFDVQENPFTDEEEGTILEAARVALSDAEVYEYVADKLDLSDKELKALQKKIESVTNRA